MQKQLAIKITIITLISLCLLIPLAMISGKIEERKNYLRHAEQSVAHSWTGSQQIMTPVLVVPYEIISTHTRANREIESASRHQHFIPLDSVSVSTDINTSLRYKGIYSIPVYETTLSLTGKIAGNKISEQKKTLQQQQGFSRFFTPSIAVYISDARGVSGQPTLSWLGEDMDVLPGTDMLHLSSGLRSEIALPKENNKFLDINIAFQLRGMRSLEFIPAAKNTEFSMQSNWPHPEFIGAFLPASSTINADGFIASWDILTGRN